MHKFFFLFSSNEKSNVDEFFLFFIHHCYLPNLNSCLAVFDGVYSSPSLALFPSQGKTDGKDGKLPSSNPSFLHGYSNLHSISTSVSQMDLSAYRLATPFALATIMGFKISHPRTSHYSERGTLTCHLRVQPNIQQPLQILLNRL